ncbi:MAG: hypothetical protein AAFX87_13050 [Bacteroidota bacterium]
MSKEVLLKQSNLEVEYDQENKLMYLNWVGFQNKEMIMESGGKILELFSSKSDCSRVLNDNRLVEGPWQDAAEWTQTVWFPQMMEAGLKYFAWIFSPNIFAELSAKQAMPEADGIKAFEGISPAKEWLLDTETKPIMA